MEQQGNRSEVARLLAQIEVEYLAGTRGLTGYAAVAQHEVITAKMERMGQIHEELQTLVGADAIRLVAERLAALPDTNAMGEEKDRLMH